MPRVGVKKTKLNASRNGRYVPTAKESIDDWAAKLNVRSISEMYHAAPVDPTLRPEHPTLGGAKFNHGVPAALDDEDFEIVATWYERVNEDLPGYVTTAMLKLARAEHAGQYEVFIRKCIGNARKGTRFARPHVAQEPRSQNLCIHFR
jgi:hypothetical protein